MTRVVLPHHLRSLAGVTGELDLAGGTLDEVLGALETAHPVLAGTLRDAATGRRRSFVRFFGDQEDLSHTAPDALLPAALRDGREPLLVVGAMAGG